MASRVLIVSFSVCPAPDRHGVGLQSVLKALAPRYTVDVLTLRPQHGELPFVERFMKTRMLRVPVGHGSLADQIEAFARAIKRQLEGEEYDAVHLRSAWGARATLGALPGGARLVYEVARSTESEPRAADEKVSASLKAEEALCLERAQLILVPTEVARAHLKRRAAKNARDDEARVMVLPLGVDIDHFDWEPLQEADPTTARILFVGRLAAGRGVRLLAHAFALVKRRHRAVLQLAGAIDPVFQPLFDEALAGLGLDEASVEVLGAIDHEDVPRLIAQATICVAPSAADPAERPLAGFPTKLLEYLACRKAVVAPRRPAVMEVITDGKEGLLFAPAARRTSPRR